MTKEINGKPWRWEGLQYPVSWESSPLSRLGTVDVVKAKMKNEIKPKQLASSVLGNRLGAGLSIG
jgi:hypothetical protein